MIKKMNILLLAVIALLFSLAPGTAAEYTYPTIVLDGRPLSIAVPAIDENGRTLIPVREFFAELDAAVNWDQDTQTVTVTGADKEIKLTIGQDTAVVNGQAVNLDTPPRVIDGRIMAPLRFVVEAIGASVAWDAETHEINIQTNPTPDQGPNLPVVPDSSPDAIGEQPDITAPAAPAPGDNKSRAIDLLNSQLSLYILVPLLLAGVLVGAIMVRRSRIGAANRQIDSSDLVNSIEATSNDGSDNEADGKDINDLTVTPDEADNFEDKYLGAIRDSAAAADVIEPADTPTSGSPIGLEQDRDTQDELKTTEADQPDEIHADTGPAEGDQPGKTLAAMDPARTDPQETVPDDRESVEAYYNKGIQMIQLQNWAEARMALVYPSIVKYRDSEELGYYIEAQEQHQESQNPSAADPYWAAVMADYYCRKIPDDYEGSFKNEIAELKARCKNTLAIHMQNLQI